MARQWAHGLPLGLSLTPDCLCMNMLAPLWALALGRGQPPASLVHGGTTLESKTQATRAAVGSSLTVTPGDRHLRGQDADGAAGRQMARHRGPLTLSHIPIWPLKPLQTHVQGVWRRKGCRGWGSLAPRHALARAQTSLPS